MVIASPGRLLVAAVCLAVSVAPALLSTAVAAVRLAAVTRTANAEYDAAAFVAAAQRQEDDDGHAPSSASP